MFVLAHLSDPHLAPMPKLRLAEFASKRALGWANWYRKRCRVHRRDILARIVADMAAQKPDHIAVVGDLVNISHPAEFAPARAWLETIGTTRDVTLVPGNHDIYVRQALDFPRQHWGEYLLGDADAEVNFPFVRRRGNVALIGVSTAVPTAPFRATGLVGAEQLERLGGLLAHAAAEGLFRAVLIHHPPRAKHHAQSKRLVDADAFRRIIAAHGAELIIHGHDHIHSLEWMESPLRPAPLVGVPSASASDVAHDNAAYNLYRITGQPGAWACEVVTRGMSRGRNDILEMKRFLLEP